MVYKEYEVITDNTSVMLHSILKSLTPNSWSRLNARYPWYTVIDSNFPWSENPKTHALIKEFVDHTRITIQKLEAYTMYDFHVDSYRNASILMSLNAFESSMTLFRAKKSSYLNMYIPNLYALQYKPKTMYLVDTTGEHCALNFGPDTRYLLSISINYPYTMMDAVSFLDKNF